jgi:hypothetical protein
MVSPHAFLRRDGRQPGRAAVEEDVLFPAVAVDVAKQTNASGFIQVPDLFPHNNGGGNMVDSRDGNNQWGGGQ